jgi:hypothetical protein
VKTIGDLRACDKSTASNLLDSVTVLTQAIKSKSKVFSSYLISTRFYFIHSIQEIVCTIELLLASIIRVASKVVTERSFQAIDALLLANTSSVLFLGLYCEFASKVWLRYEIFIHFCSY